MKVSVSLADFYYWEDRFGIEEKLKYLELIEGLDVDGVELHLSEDEIMEEKFRLFEGRLGKYTVTVHLPAITRPGEIFEKARKMKGLLDVEHFVLHADQLGSAAVPSDIPIVIENLDRRHHHFRDLREVQKLGKDICFDIEHVQENFPGHVEEQAMLAKDMIKEIHLSCVKNGSYEGLGTEGHSLFTGSDFHIPDCLPKDCIWSIEGIIPKGRLDLLEKEIAFLRKLDG